MNSAVSEPTLIGVDWGTTSLRAFLIDTDGQVVDDAASPDGIMQMSGKSFEAVLDRLIGHWIEQSNLPILASGMVTSRNGWIETPYESIPLGAYNLAQTLVPFETNGGARLHFVTGASVEHVSGPDVMRGEETQIIGASALGINVGTFVMPGTHSKWVQVADGKIVDFSTYMTGEIFKALKEHTILGTLMEDYDFDLLAFESGVTAGLDSNANLLHQLFHVRTLPLLDKLPKTAASDYLSGLLIGTEVAAAANKIKTYEAVTLIGRGDLTERYEVALRLAGLECQHAPNNIVAKGHFLIAQAAGLVK